MAEELKKTKKTPTKKTSSTKIVKETKTEKTPAKKTSSTKIVKETKTKKISSTAISKKELEVEKTSKPAKKSKVSETIKNVVGKTKLKKTEKVVKLKRTKILDNKTIMFKNTEKLPKAIFGLPNEKINTQAIFDSILFERASRRQGTHSTKTRAEVRGGGKKPWRQKGTGRARAGSTRSPIWVGGGIAFGPKPEKNYNFKVNKKVRNLAFLSSFTLLANKNAILVDELALESISTKELIKKLDDMKINNLRKILIVSSDEKIYKSGKNVKNLHIVKLNSLTVELLNETQALLLSKKDLVALESRVK